jgi:hypothetical protein
VFLGVDRVMEEGRGFWFTWKRNKENRRILLLLQQRNKEERNFYCKTLQKLREFRGRRRRWCVKWREECLLFIVNWMALIFLGKFDPTAGTTSWAASWASIQRRKERWTKGLHLAWTAKINIELIDQRLRVLHLGRWLMKES